MATEVFGDNGGGLVRLTTDSSAVRAFLKARMKPQASIGGTAVTKYSDNVWFVSKRLGAEVQALIDSGELQ